MRLKWWVLGICTIYVIAVLIYAFQIQPGYVPPQYKGTPADPSTFMSHSQIMEIHSLTVIRVLHFFLVTPFSLILPLLLLGVSHRLRSYIERRSRYFVLQAIGYLFAYLLLTAVIFFPLNVLFYVINLAYGLTSQPFLSWLSDLFMGFFIDYFETLIVVVVVFWLIRKSPKRWWLYTWLLSVPFLFVMVFIQPLYLDPVFNKFQPITNAHQREEILTIAHRAGIPNAEIFVVNKSKQSNAINAYVTGVGNSARIVVWDTTLQDLTDSELQFVVGHETGHYVHHDVPHATIAGAFGGIIVAYITFWLYRRMLPRFERRHGLSGQGDLAAYPLLAFTLSLLMLVASPVESAISRVVEHRADVWGLGLTHNDQAAVAAFQQITIRSLAEVSPPPVLQFFYGNHPTLLERIEYASQFK